MAAARNSYAYQNQVTLAWRYPPSVLENHMNHGCVGGRNENGYTESSSRKSVSSLVQDLTKGPPMSFEN